MSKFDDPALERQLLSIGLPDDFPEIVLAGEIEPSREALERIKAKTLTRIGTRPAGRPAGERLRRLAWWKAAAAALLLLVAAAVIWIGPLQVWAGLQRALNLVPGFGVVDRDIEGFPLVSLEQVKAEADGGYAQLAGMLARSDATYVKLSFKGLTGYTFSVDDVNEFYKFCGQAKKRARRIYLVDDQGTEYRMKQRAEIGWYFSEYRYGRYNLKSGFITCITLQLPPLSGQNRRVTVIIPMEKGPDLKLTADLLPLEVAAGRFSNNQSARAGGVDVTAGVHFGDETWIYLAFDPPHESSQVTLINWPYGGNAEVRGIKGGSYPLLRTGQPWEANYLEQFHKGIVPEEENITLTLKTIRFRDRAKTRLRLPIPREGYQDLHIPVRLGYFNFTITGVESKYMHYQKTLVIHIHPEREGPEVFDGFHASIGFLGRKGISSHWHTYESGEMEYTIYVPENRKNIGLTLHDPMYYVEGPWSFTFPVDNLND